MRNGANKHTKPELSLSPCMLAGNVTKKSWESNEKHGNGNGKYILIWSYSCTRALRQKVEDFKGISMGFMVLLSKRTIKNLTTEWIRSIRERKRERERAKKITLNARHHQRENDLKNQKEKKNWSKNKTKNENHIRFLIFFTTEFSHFQLCFDTFVFQQSSTPIVLDCF